MKTNQNIKINVDEFLNIRNIGLFLLTIYAAPILFFVLVSEGNNKDVHFTILASSAILMFLLRFFKQGASQHESLYLLLLSIPVIQIFVAFHIYSALVVVPLFFMAVIFRQWLYLILSLFGYICYALYKNDFNIGLDAYSLFILTSIIIWSSIIWNGIYSQYIVKNEQITKYHNEKDIYFKYLSDINNYDSFQLPENTAGDNILSIIKNLGNKILIKNEEDKIRQWNIDSVTGFNKLTRDRQNTEDFYFECIEYLIETIKANQGGIFVINNSEERNSKEFNLAASFAYDRRKYRTKNVPVNVGLLGQVYNEKAMVHLTNIPDNYMTITSGLGQATPKSLVIVPIIHNEEIIGALEIASFNDFKDYELEFLKNAGSNIGSIIANKKQKEITEKLLFEAREQAETLKAQEEELRQNMEELEATHEQQERLAKEKEKAEEKVRKTQEFLDLIVDSVPVAIFAKNRAHEMVIANKAVCDLNNMTREQLIGKTDFDFFEKEQAQVFWDDEEKLFKDGKLVEKEEYVIRNGIETYTIDRKLPVTSSDGEEYLVGVNLEITELKKAQEAAQKAQEFIGLILDSVPVPIFVKDREHHFLIVNKAATTLNNLVKEDVIGKTDFDLFPHEQAQKFFNNEELIFKDRKAIEVENCVSRKGYDTYSIDKKLVIEDSSGDLFLIGTNIDITEAKLAQMQLYETKLMLSKILQTTSEMYYFKNSQHKYIVYSQCYLNQNDIKDDITDQGDEALLPKQDVEKLKKIEKETFEGKSPTLEIKIPSKHMKRIKNYAPLYDNEGGIPLIYCSEKHIKS